MSKDFKRKNFLIVSLYDKKVHFKFYKRPNKLIQTHYSLFFYGRAPLLPPLHSLMVKGSKPRREITPRNKLLRFWSPLLRFWSHCVTLR